jgi:alpha-mannosidase
METETKPTRLVLALATPSLEELPQCASTPEEATSLYHDYHAAWTALWSPLILASTGFLPESRRADTSGLDLENSLLIVPDVSKSKIDQPLEERLLLAGNHLLFSGSRTRPEISLAVLQAFAPGSQALALEELSTEARELEQDFCSFGFAVMQVQQMARKLRYSFNLDWMVVSDQLIQAAQSFMRSEYQESQRWLSAAYDSLSQERDRYCSQQGHLIHLVLSAPSTLGRRFSAQMQQCDVPTNLLATYETIEQLKQSNPLGFDELIHRIDQRTLAIAGGFYREVTHTYLSELSLNRSFFRAKKAASSLGLNFVQTLAPFFGAIPAHFPTMAKLHGFQGMVLEKFHGGLIPEKEHAKLKWQATSESPAIDMILGHMIDASDPLSLLELGSAMANQLDYHQVPTLVIAHWPDRASPIFDDLVRTVKRSPALGKWILVDDYFQSTSQPYWSEQFGVQQFPFSIPKEAQAVHETQISLLHLNRYVYQLERLSGTIQCWSAAGKGKNQESKPQESTQQELLLKTQEILDQLDEIAEHSKPWLTEPHSWTASFETKLKSLVDQCTGFIESKLGACSNWTIVHTASHPRRLSLELPSAIASKDHAGMAQVVASDRLRKDPSKTHWVVDLPPYGFTQIPGPAPGIHATNQSTQTAKTKSSGFFSKLLGQKNTIGQPDGSLANEHMEIQVDPKKGHLRSVHIRDQRGNQLSGMACLVPGPVGSETLRNQADFIGLSRIEVQNHDISDSNAICTTRGVFEQASQENKSCPWLEQTVRMQRGCKWVQVDFSGGGFDRNSVTPIWRTAWPSQAATLQVWSHGNRSKWLGPLQASIELIEIDDAQHKVYIATGGLSYHLKQGANQLITLLPVDAQGNLSASIVLGIDWQRPWETAIDFFQPAWVIPPAGESMALNRDEQPVCRSGWLAQSNHWNLRFSFLPTESSPRGQGSYSDATQTVFPDVLIWMTESAGKSSTAKISLPKTAVSAWKVDFSGQLMDKIPVEGSDLLVPYSAWEKSVLAVVLGP